MLHFTTKVWMNSKHQHTQRLRSQNISVRLNSSDYYLPFRMCLFINTIETQLHLATGKALYSVYSTRWASK